MPLVSTVKFDAVASSGSFEIELSLYVNPDFSTPIGVDHKSKFNIEL